MKKNVKKPVEKPQKRKVSRKTVAKVAGVVGAVGLGAALYSKRDKVKKFVGRLISKVKKAS